MGTLLESIHSPADLKRLSFAQMTDLAEEIREFLIQTLSRTGGHLGPNLGVVELTMALHTVFNTPEDKILFDVSHQSYIHKMLTGRLDQMETIRQPGGITGFTLRTESEHDCYGAGHAGTALSAALGIAVARDLAGGTENVIAVAGDAAFTNGLTFEAINNIAVQTKRLIVVLNDNEWAIDRNVGAIATASTASSPTSATRTCTTRPTASSSASAARWRSRWLAAPKRPPRASSGLPSSLRSLACSTTVPSTATTSRCWWRPSSSSRLKPAPSCSTFSRRRAAASSPRSTGRRSFTASAPSTPRPARPRPPVKPTYSEIFAKTLVQAGRDRDERIVAITAAMPSGTGLDIFRASYPKRCFDVGIAEEPRCRLCRRHGLAWQPARLRHLLQLHAAQL
jgi:1-deoxy-D-xylulose-5-phosphate synthase